MSIPHHGDRSRSLRRRTLTCQLDLSSVDWYSSPHFMSSMHRYPGDADSDDDDLADAASSPPPAIASPCTRSVSADGHRRFARFHTQHLAAEKPLKMTKAAPRARASVKSSMDERRAVEESSARRGASKSARRTRARARTRSFSVCLEGNISHSGPIKLGTGTLTSYSGPIKGSLTSYSGPIKGSAKVAAPSIIPAGVLGQKKPLPFDAEPTSPHVTCLGKIKIRHRECKAAVQLSQRLEQKNREEFSEKKVRKDCEGTKKKKKLKKRLLRKQSRRASAQVDDGAPARGSLRSPVDLSRFGGSCQFAETRRERGAMLATCLLSMLQQPWRLEDDRVEYVPQVPPPNSLLLMRGFRNLGHCHQQLEVVNADYMAQEGKTMMPHCDLSFCRPLPETSLWERRAIAKPSDLDIMRPVKQKIKKPC